MSEESEQKEEIPKPVEKPAEEIAAEEKPAEEKPAEEKPAEEKPAEEKPTEEKPSVKETNFNTPCPHEHLPSCPHSKYSEKQMKKAVVLKAEALKLPQQFSIDYGDKFAPKKRKSGFTMRIFGILLAAGLLAFFLFTLIKFGPWLFHLTSAEFKFKKSGHGQTESQKKVETAGILNLGVKKIKPEQKDDQKIAIDSIPVPEGTENLSKWSEFPIPNHWRQKSRSNFKPETLNSNQPVIFDYYQEEKTLPSEKTEFLSNSTEKTENSSEFYDYELENGPIFSNSEKSESDDSEKSEISETTEYSDYYDDNYYDDFSNYSSLERTSAEEYPAYGSFKGSQMREMPVNFDYYDDHDESSKSKSSYYDNWRPWVHPSWGRRPKNPYKNRKFHASSSRSSFSSSDSSENRDRLIYYPSRKAPRIRHFQLSNKFDRQLDDIFRNFNWPGNVNNNDNEFMNYFINLNDFENFN